MFVYKKGLGTQQVFDDVPQSNVAIAKGDLLYGASGYASNAYASFITSLMIGVANETYDNSGGAAGAHNLNCDICPLSEFVADCADTATQATAWTNVACASANTVTSLTAKTDKTGVLKIMKFISSAKVLVKINFASPTEA